MDCIVYGVAKSRTRLSDFHFFSFLSTNLACLLAFKQQATGPHTIFSDTFEPWKSVVLKGKTPNILATFPSRLTE